MPKSAEEELKLIQARIFLSDYEYLKLIYGPTNEMNSIIREVVRDFVIRVKSKEAEILKEDLNVSNI